MERWLRNVAEAQKQTPADLLLVDNSSGTDYLNKVTAYCEKIGIKNYKIEHFEVNNENAVGAVNQKIEIAQEIIRRAALGGGYDAWFSWECDQIIPLDTLDKLAGFMESGNYAMVVCNSWTRSSPDTFNANMGCTLIGKKAIKIGWFLEKKDEKINFDLADRMVDEMMFRKRVLENGGSYIEIYGLVNPIYHLDK